MRSGAQLIIESIELFLRISRRISDLETIPRDFGTSYLLYPSEIHLLDVIGRYPEINVSEAAARLGVTKGFVSKMSGRLLTKNLILRFKEANNDKEILLKLSDTGKQAFEGHIAFHQDLNHRILQTLEAQSDEQIEIILKILSDIDCYLSELTSASH